jgi:hypothetical protein
MKHNHDHGRSHHDKGHSTEPGLVSVNFEYTDPRARTVSVAGTFNDWHPTTKSMYSSGSGRCLVVDGQWRPDPLAKETVPNPFGGRNSVLTVAAG